MCSRPLEKEYQVGNRPYGPVRHHCDCHICVTTTNGNTVAKREPVEHPTVRKSLPAKKPAFESVATKLLARARGAAPPPLTRVERRKLERALWEREERARGEGVVFERRRGFEGLSEGERMMIRRDYKERKARRAGAGAVGRVGGPGWGWELRGERSDRYCGIDDSLFWMLWVTAGSAVGLWACEAHSSRRVKSRQRLSRRLCRDFRFTRGSNMRTLN